MKKNLLIILIIFIISSLNVYALGLDLDCKTNSLTVNESLECNLKLESDGNLKRLSFNIETNFDKSIKSDGYSISQNDNDVVIDFNSNFSNNTVASITLNTNSKTITGNNRLLLNSIKVIDNEDNELKLDDIEKTIIVQENNLSNDAFLTKIVVDGMELDDFSPNKFSYDNIYVSKQIVFIDAVRHNEKASVTGLGNVRVKPNETITRVLRVTAENGDVLEYMLKITNGVAPTDDDVKPDVISSDNRIKNLSLYYKDEKINLHFDSSKTVYNVVLPRSEMDMITIQATVNDAKASFVKNYEPRDYNISYGDNKIELRVMAENGRVLTYLINVTRNDDRSNDNSLASLKINDKEIELENDILEYYITLTYNEQRTKVEAKAQEENAEIVYQDINLVDGINTPLIIKVIAENGNAREYKINITRLKEEESKLLLESIKINGFDFPFILDSYVYDLNVNEDTTSLDIVVTPTLIHHEIEGNSDLEDKSIVRVKVMDSDGLRTYIINIHKPVKDEFMIVYYFVFGIGVIAFVSSVIYAIGVNKKKK